MTFPSLCLAAWLGLQWLSLEDTPACSAYLWERNRVMTDTLDAAQQRLEWQQEQAMQLRDL